MVFILVPEWEHSQQERSYNYHAFREIAAQIQEWKFLEHGKNLISLFFAV